jgi:hypothetical protein
MAVRRPKKFSVPKAVKANAREYVGQPKPSRPLDDAVRTGREEKHRKTLRKLLEQE